MFCLLLVAAVNMNKSSLPEFFFIGMIASFNSFLLRGHCTRLSATHAAKIFMMNDDIIKREVLSKIFGRQ